MEARNVDDYVELNPTRQPTTVPLLGRLVNYQPLSSVNPKLKSYPLRELSSPDQGRIREALLVRDLLNVLIGLEGAYIRYNNRYDPYNDINSVPEFKIAKSMDSSLKSFSKRLSRLGKYYIVLGKVAEHWSDSKHGMVLHRLGYEIRQFIQNRYLKFLVTRLVPEFKNNTTFSIREMEQLIQEAEIAKQMELLYAICDRIDKETSRRQSLDRTQVDFNNFMDDLKDQGQLQSDMILATDTRIFPVAKGGIILRILQDLIQENLGDRSSVQFLKSLLLNISTDFQSMLENWLTQGQLHDPYDEFMIIDTMRQLKDTPLSLKYGDRLWDTRYMIRKDALPRNLTIREDGELMFKILSTGKLLNVVKTSLGIKKLPITNSQLKAPISSGPSLMDGTHWELVVDEWYQRANILCLELFLKGYRLTDFLIQLQRHFFGYQNSHNVMKFLNRNMVDLTRKYRPHGIEEARIRRNFELEHRSDRDLVIRLLNLQPDSHSFANTIAQYASQSTAMMARDSGARLLNANSFETLKNMLLQDYNESNNNTRDQSSVIHHLQFEILIPYPLNVVVTRTCTVQYQVISRYVFILQYYSRLLDDTWSEINKNKLWRQRYQYNNQVIKRFIRPCRLLHNKMNQFVKLLLEYFTTDVIDKELSYVITNGMTSDTVLALQILLQESLTNIMTNCCLSQLAQIQLQILEIIHKFCKFITSLRVEMPFLQQEEGDNLETHLSPLVNYTKLVRMTFHEHLQAFKEGLVHYHTESTGSNDSRRDTFRMMLSLRIFPR